MDNDRDYDYSTDGPEIDDSVYACPKCDTPMDKTTRQAIEQRDRAIQIIIDMQDYLRTNGRNFLAAETFIEEAKLNGWAGLCGKCDNTGSVENRLGIVSHSCKNYKGLDVLNYHE